jgi:hypothetical protein
MASMQTARLVDRGTGRLAPYYLHVQNDRSDDGELEAEVYGGLIGFRMDDAVEMQLRYDGTHFWGDVEGDQNFIALGPKFGLTENAAILIPVGLYVDSGVESFETVHILPGIILSHPFGRYVEPIVSGRLVLPFKDNLDTFGTLSAGISLSPWPTAFAVIPEVGMAWNLSDDTVDELLSVGAGVSFFPK